MTMQGERANGAKSRGPITAQGKRNSSRNGLRHDFSIEDPSLSKNPPEDRVTLRTAYMAEFQPCVPFEVYMRLAAL